MRRRRITSSQQASDGLQGEMFADVIYVQHAFQKKAQKTPKPDRDLAATRDRKLIGAPK
ncbi:MAG: type II toxin-antitoxin system RelE/ParE family toxin [Pigmentiphaga sp.]